MSRTPPIAEATSRREVDILDIFQIIWQGKHVVLMLGALFGFSAFMYASLVSSEYRVISVLRPAALNELDALNRSGVYTLSPIEALKKVGSALESYGVRLEFFKANQVLFSHLQRPGVTLEQSFESFNKSSLKVIAPVSDKADSLSALVRLELRYPEDLDGVLILNSFVDYAIKVEREQIEADLKVIIDNRLAELKGKIDAARSEYDMGMQARIATLIETDDVKRSILKDELVALRKQLKVGRMDRIAQLSEAIGIAQSLGIQKPTTPAGLAESHRAGDSSVIYTEINNQHIPLYFMGVETLEAERSALLKRKTDDFTDGRIAQIAREMFMLESNREVEVLNQRQNEEVFLSGVQPFRADIVRLGNLSNLEISNIQLVTIDRKALEPLSPIKPRRMLLLILGGLLGVGLGALVVLLRSAAVARRVNFQSVESSAA
ncbi:chain-length determining protein [Pseudomonas endophytica]|uniref:chain-length determining protein n=1 Tax=Pseudomonas endophytica TaxID=1563157 RepID=UPI000B32C18C|nr:chain-length determining protein [Pseudomonas endophytica]